MPHRRPAPCTLNPPAHPHRCWPAPFRSSPPLPVVFPSGRSLRLPASRPSSPPPRHFSPPPPAAPPAGARSGAPLLADLISSLRPALCKPAMLKTPKQEAEGALHWPRYASVALAGSQVVCGRPATNPCHSAAFCPPRSTPSHQAATQQAAMLSRALAGAAAASPGPAVVAYAASSRLGALLRRPTASKAGEQARWGGGRRRAAPPPPSPSARPTSSAARRGHRRRQPNSAMFTSSLPQQRCTISSSAR